MSRYFEQVATEKPDAHGGHDSGSSRQSGSKNKGADDNAQAPTTTLFVSGLPFSATSTDLSTLFSDIGPLRKCFVVTDPVSKKSKGVGYVQYAVKEDAERALQELDGKKEGVLDGKRAIRLEWARGRATLKERSEKRKRGADGAAAARDEALLASAPVAQPEASASASAKPKHERPAKRPRAAADKGAGASGEGTDAKGPSDRDPNASRTLVLRGLAGCSPAADQKALYKRLRKLAPVESVVYPAPVDGEGASAEAQQSAATAKDKKGKGKGKGKGKNAAAAPAGDVDTAFVLFATANHALSAQSSLTGRTFRGRVLRAEPKRAWDGLQRLERAVTNPATRARRADAAAQIEKESTLPPVVRAALAKAGTKGAKALAPPAPAQGRDGAPAAPWTLTAQVDGRIALARAGGGAVATGKMDKKSRLIVRNLPFDVTADDLRAIFLPFGPLYKIDVPQTDKPATDRRPRKGKKGKGSEKAADDKEEDESDSGSGSDDDEDSDDEDASDGDQSDSDAEMDAESDAQDATLITQQEDQTLASASSADSSDSDDEEDESEEEEDDEDSESDASEADAADEEAAKADSEAAAPTSEEAEVSTATRGRGFAFVWFVSYGDAAHALSSVNGTSIQHGAAERLAYKCALHSRDRRQIKAVLDRIKRDAQPARTVAVDWSLAKDEWQKKVEEEVDEDDEAADEAKDDADSDLEPVALDDADKSDAASTQKGTLPQPEEGTTLFIRNLPFTATEAELKELFRKFGSLRYARITMDKASGKPKGNGFVCFWAKESADKVLEQADLVQRESGAASMTGPNAVGMGPSKTANPFSMSASTSAVAPATNHYSSLLTADVSAPLAAGLSLHGRLLSVTPAIKREEAQAKEATAQALRQKGDKRNTWLLREGVPFPNSPLAARIAGGKAGAPNTAEIDKRLQSFTIRRKQLETNPALFVSKTRLSVRNLPLFVTDKVLKRLALHSVKEFAREAKAGERADLTAEEQRDATLSPALEQGSERKRAKFVRERPTAVVQSKVVRQADRLDPILGGSAGRSRGYGFLEMRSFNDALKVVRWANGNREVSKLFLQWHVEELDKAIEKLRKELAAGDGAASGGKKGKTTSKADAADGAAGAAAAKEDGAARLKRLLKRAAELKEAGAKALDKGERGGLLVIEFSIENVTITRKRQERAEGHKRAVARGRDEEPTDTRSNRREDGKDKGKKRESWNKKTSSSSSGTASAPAANASKRLAKQADARVKAAKQDRRRDGSGGAKEKAGGFAPASSVSRIISKKRKEKKGKRA